MIFPPNQTIFFKSMLYLWKMIFLDLVCKGIPYCFFPLENNYRISLKKDNSIAKLMLNDKITHRTEGTKQRTESEERTSETITAVARARERVWFGGNIKSK